MNKKQAVRIVGWSTLALIVPILGQLFINGWNWDWHDYLLAWVFFNILGFVFVFVTNKVTHRTWRVAAGALIILVFAAVWVMLATG